MADAQPAGRPCCCLTFLNEALLLPARNRSVFLPTFTLSVAYTGFVDHAYTLALAGVLRPNAMAATYLLAALAGPAIRAITSAAAVAAYTERQTSFCALVLEELRGGLFKASTTATAADANVLWLAHRVIGGAALRVVTTQLFVRFLLTPLLMDLLVALHLVHRLLGNYLAAVSALAVVVSSSSKLAACHGTAALRRAWRITRCNAAWSAVLVAAQGFLAGVVPQWCEDAARRAFERILWTVHVLLRGGAAVLGVCAAPRRSTTGARRG